jgi:hypothetical protein
MEKNLMQELIVVSNSHNMSIQSAWQQVQASFETPNQLLEFFNLSKRELLAFQQQWGLV